VIATGIKSQVFSRRIANRPKIANGIAIIGAMKVTDRQCWFSALPVVKHTLRTQKNIRHAVSAGPVSCKVRYRFSYNQKLQTRRDGKLYNFVEAVPRAKLRPMGCRYKPVSNWRYPTGVSVAGVETVGRPGFASGSSTPPDCAAMGWDAKVRSRR